MDIQIFTAGGTIDKIYFDAKSEFKIGEPQIGSLLREANVSFEWQRESLLRKDSLEMTDDDRDLIRQRVCACKLDRILITHGTDTMVETAKNLLDIPGKIIVLTGSMQPARLRESDAIFNIGFAIGLLQSKPPGVYVAMNGRAFDPRHVHKNRDQQRFEAE